MLTPIKAEPFDVLHDGIHILGFLSGRVCVVEPQVAAAAVHLCQAEVDGDGLCVADVQVAVGLGREARADDVALHIFALGNATSLRQVRIDDLLQKTEGLLLCRGLGRQRTPCSPAWGSRCRRRLLLYGRALGGRRLGSGLLLDGRALGGRRLGSVSRRGSCGLRGGLHLLREPQNSRRAADRYPDAREVGDLRRHAGGGGGGGAEGRVLSPPQAGTGGTIDGKQFFRQARSQLSYEAFNDFLSNIKKLNNQQQTREETLDEARRIFGPEGQHLYKEFELLLNRHAV
mmetsp:Transcript_117474/g.374360  ORF Transcript_117474/g.374360 Transcript_117474/m.374360 type:complete len:287 (+) Transcript_117474:1718-2578(+)